MAKIASKHSDNRLLELSDWLAGREAQMVESVRELVLRESPTGDKAACDALCSYLAASFEKLGGRVTLHRQPLAGNHLQVNFSGKQSNRPLLLLGHFDTVYDRGTLQNMPWRQHQGRLFGPGVFDMKAGIVQMLFALAAWLDLSQRLPRPVTVLLVSDEEEGSQTSRAITEKVAALCAAVLVCEPSGPGGALKTARKGVGSFRLTVRGQAAHSGLDFEKGQSAILELAQQVLAIASLTDLKRGTTLNVGTIRGGTRTNVVADEAVAELDLRVKSKAEGTRMEHKIRRLRTFNRQCKLEIDGSINRPPLERTPDVVKLFETAHNIAAKLDIPLKEIAVGGGSDGNFTAGIGIPTLDGLGAVGEGAHAAHESVVAAEMPRRAALLAALIAAIS